MSHVFKRYILVISVVLGLGDRALGQCFVCSDADKNTAVGASALSANSTGANNVAAGANALFANTTGANNTAAGFSALHNNTTGANNNASGVEALFNNTTAGDNNAMGHAALFSNTMGTRNSAVGSETLYLNTTGSFNNATGYLALYHNTTGSYNVGIGYEAGYYLTSGNNNIDIGNTGIATDSGTIKIGAAGVQTATYIAGIENAKITGSAVYVTVSGQLGVLASSERYKTAIAPIGADTGKLQQLRPVSFHLKSDPNGAVQYGLIAEEVDKVYPELVVRDAAGQVQGVRYEELTPMLLSEVQQLKRQMAELKRANKSLRAAMASLASKDAPATTR